MSNIKKMTTAYLARFTKSHGFQRIQKELVLTANTLLSGSTMGARIRRREMIAMIKEVHSIVLAQTKTHGDKAAFDALETAAAEREALLAEAAKVAEILAAEAEKAEAAKELPVTSGVESPTITAETATKDSTEASKEDTTKVEDKAEVKVKDRA